MLLFRTRGVGAAASSLLPARSLARSPLTPSLSRPLVPPFKQHQQQRPGGHGYSPNGVSLAELRAHGPQQLRQTRMGAAAAATAAGGGEAGAGGGAAAAAAAAAQGPADPDETPEAPPNLREPRLWMALNGRVYDITAYLPFHPGGSQILEKASGTDATALFRRYHPWVNAGALLEACCLGRLGGGAGAGGGGGSGLGAGGGAGGGTGAVAAPPGGGGSSSSSPPGKQAPSAPSSFSAGVRSLFGRGGGGG